MNTFHAIEPNRLKMIWQSAGSDRRKFVVGEVIRTANEYSLCYFINSEDFVQACWAGFLGHPAFDVTTPCHHRNVMEILSRRLPPRTRSDYPFYVGKFGLDPNQPISEFLLLSYSHGKLPSDGFSFAVDFRFQEIPFIFNMEVSGFRYSEGMNLDSATLLNQNVMFYVENDNPHDPNAIRIEIFGRKIGYIPRYYAEDIRRWSNFCRFGGFIQRIEGPFSKPEVYLTMYITKLEPAVLG